MIRNVKDVRIKIQPIKMKSALELWTSDEVPVAKQTWVLGPKKPRDALRKKELPPEDVSLEALEKMDLVEVLDSVRVDKKEDVKKISKDADVILIGDSEDWLTEEEILDEIALLNKPLITEWDNWGYAIHGRLSKFRFNKYSKVKYFIPMGAKDVLSFLRAARGWKLLKTLRVLYIGKYPPRSVAVPRSVSVKYIRENLGPEIVQISIEEYMETLKSIKDEEAKGIAKEWKTKFQIIDNREKTLREYAKIYVALKKLLEKYNANAVTVECPALPDIEYVPCVAFSLLIDEGIPCGCEADLPALFTLTILMGISGRAALMGNLNENVTHIDIEKNIITINHDIVPPSYACPWCKFKIMDYHNMNKGATPYAELLEGAPVTLAGMHWDMDKIWATEGEIAWTEDTVHCRVCVGVKVKDAKKVSREAFGHHIVLIYGNYIEELKKLADLAGLEFFPFKFL